MFGIQNYYSFLLAVIIFQLIPGAGTITILHTTTCYGRSAGVSAVLGTLTGDFIFMLAAVIGLAAILQSHPFLFSSLQWLGSAYLCWFGIQLLKAKRTGNSSNLQPKPSLWANYRKACIVSLTNPKVILFFVSFFPLFLSSDSSFTTLVILMAHVVIISFCYQLLLVILGTLAVRMFKKWPNANQIATKLAGTALIGLGIKLGLENTKG